VSHRFADRFSVKHRHLWLNDFSPSDVVTVDYLTLSIPEPGTIALMGVATAGLFLARNKTRPEDRIIRKLQRRR